jgi:hypothetical protein
VASPFRLQPAIRSTIVDFDQIDNPIRVSLLLPTWDGARNWASHCHSLAVAG